MSLRFKILYVFLLFFVSNLQGQTNYSASVYKGCVPLTVNFFDNSTGAVTWEWDFGNGNKSTLQNPSAIYYASGQFTVKLTTWDASGNSTSITKTNVIRVFKNPVASFNATPNPVCAGESVTFNSTSTPGDTTINKYSWDFGNGMLSNKASPTFAYNSAGLFSISMVVTDGHGCQDKLLLNNYLRVKPTPKALFSVDSSFNCQVPTTLWFQNKSTGGSLSYSWNFGDGGTSTQKSPKYTYNSLGTFSPSLTVTDTNGCKNTYTITGGVYMGPIAADFTASPVKICGTGNVQFKLVGGAQPSVRYDWDFGDGSTLQKSNPSHLYSKPGVYTVKMVATSLYRPCSSAVEKKQLIKVDPKPNGKITLSDSFPCKPPFTVALTYSDTMPLQTINWFFALNGKTTSAGSGNSINQTIFDYSARTYKAIVTTKAGCTDTVVLDWEVKSDSVIADFAGETQGCKPFYAKLEDKSISDYPITSWRWVFHTGSEAYEEKPKFLYTDTGRFPVKLHVKTTNGCEDSILKYVFVGLKTDPKFYLGKLQYICNNSDEVSFFNATQYPGFKIDSFRWVFDDEGKFSKKIPVTQTSYKSTNVKHKYDRDTGMIVPMLISYHRGCPDTIRKPDSLFMNPPFAKATKVQSPCNGDSLFLANTSVLSDSVIWVVILTDEQHKTAIDSNLYYTDSFKISGNNFYNIILWTWNKKSGCYDTLLLQHDPPEPLEFCVPTLSSFCAPSTVNICVKSTPAVPKFYWTLNGKDTIFNQENHTYNLDTPGTYIIDFVQDFGKNCIRRNTWPVSIQNGTLSGKVTQPTSCLPAKIKLIDSTWTPGPVKHAWRMSNGDVVLSTAKELEYTINNVFADTLIVSLTNEPDIGACRPFKVFIIPVSGPGVQLNWAWNSLSCTDIRFAGNANINQDKGAKPFTTNWNMGDGTTYSNQTISHKFKDTGWYTVVLTLTDANGCKAVQTEKIYVPENRLNVKITADTLGAACPPLYVSFKDISTSGNVAIKSWEWDFGDGVTSTLKNPKHQYLLPGRFTVTLKITDAQGCTRTVKFPDFITISGPFGVYKFDNTEGCYPLKVTFEDSVSKNTAYAEWDFGDGVVATSFDPSHVYKRPGRYIPALVLKDVLGCKYPVPPVDTIYIYDYPIADFNHQGVCLRDSVNLKSLSVTRDEPIAKWRWETAGPQSYTGSDVNIKFLNRNTQIHHIVTTTKGCSDTATKSIPLKQPTISVSSAKDTICLGSIWNAKGTYKLDTALYSKSWTLNGNFYDTSDNIYYRATKSGQYRFRMQVTDAAGCWDTASKPWPLTVGDTVIPKIVPILRVSVEDDISHHIKFRKYPDFDFSKYTILRDNGGFWTPIKQITNRNDTFQYLSGVDALHRSYCYKVSTQNLCGFTQNTDVLFNHCTVEVGGLPALNASLLDWNPYSGWPVQRYVVYREDHHNPGSFDSIGTVNGNTLKYIDSSIICYVNHVYRIKAHELGGNREWSWSDTCHVRPIYFNIVPPPEVRRATVVNDKYVRMEWDELKKNRQPLDYYLLEKKTAHKPWTWLKTSPAIDSFAYNDFKTWVDDESYIYRLSAVDVCNDTSVYSNVGKSILLKTEVNSDFRPVLNWTAYKEWKEGVKEYVIEKRNGSGAFIEVGRTPTGNDTNYLDAVSSLNCVPIFEYRVYAIRNTPIGLPDSVWDVRSYSNVDGPPVETKIFIPNAFTPDGNSINEGFRPDGIYIASYTMKIYNRWGEKVYEGDACMNAWDGTYLGANAQEGVYAYLVDARGSDGKVYRFTGDVTLLR
ncbi:MAG: PKD domain-containing protein [Bacteroidia bacterium]|nr:PKD domain-containing protein [Bacteroidia bacterium]